MLDMDMATMLLPMVMPTMDMDIPMLLDTTDTTRGPLMLNPLMDIMLMAMDTPPMVMLTTVMDTLLPTTTTRDLLMLKLPMVMDTLMAMDTPVPMAMDMPLMSTTTTRDLPMLKLPMVMDMLMVMDTPVPTDMPTMDTTDIIINLLNIVKS